VFLNKHPVQLSLFDSISAECDIPLAELANLRYPFLRVRLNKRMRSSWRVDWNGDRTQGVVIVPAILELAPLNIKTTVLDWAMLMRKDKRTWKSRYRRQKCQLEEIVWNFLQDPFHSRYKNGSGKDRKKVEISQRVLKGNSRRIQHLRPHGNHHNLDRVFQRINREYFEGKLRARLTWSSRLGGLSTHNIEQDAQGNNYNLITISQGYDFKDVSEEILGGVIYHEGLHIAIPPSFKNGRRTVHGREFRRREKLYRHYSEWVQWHNNELGKKLRILRWRRSMEKLRNRVKGWGR